jgi:serine/threonine protein kinase
VGDPFDPTAPDRHPSDEDIVSFIEGRIDAFGRRQLEAHLDQCETCHDLVADYARAFGVGERVQTAVGGVLATAAMRVPVKEQTGLGIESVGRYRIIRRLGAGGMGTVFLAHDIAMDRRVALKLVTESHGFVSRKVHKRMLREARALARLAHPNVVAAYDVGIAGEQLYVAMEYVEGCTLSAWLGVQPRSIHERLEVLVQAGRGISAAHCAGIIHRDLKPANIMVGSDGRVRVVDFGLARVEGGPTAESAVHMGISDVHTTTGSLVGTPRYMAPEQFALKRADAKSDQFSFAVTAYEAIYGAHPFPATDVEQLAAIVSTGQFAIPITSEVPERVGDALARAMDPRPERRFDTIDDLLAALTVVEPAMPADIPPRRSLARAVMIVAIAGLAVGALLARLTADRAWSKPKAPGELADVVSSAIGRVPSASSSAPEAPSAQPSR